MGFQDELRAAMRTKEEADKLNQEKLNNTLRAEARRVVDELQKVLIAKVKSADYTEENGKAIVTGIFPLSRRFLISRRVDNNAAVIANSKKWLFKDPSVVYRAFYYFELNSTYAEEYEQLKRYIRAMATNDKITAEFVLYDKHKKEVHPFPTRIDNSLLECDFTLAVHGTTKIDI